MKTNGTLQELKEYASARRKRKKWLTAVTCLAGIVVFCTVYALILPAIALERDAQCGLEEHQHTDDCYESTYVYPQAVMKCSLESLGIHTHTEECRNEEGTLVCGYADFVIHTHDSYCYSEDGALICTLPEIEAHTHGNECYDENGTLICGKTEIIPHTHTADCRDAEGNLICGQTEIQAHQHTGDCIQAPEGEAQEVRTLICGLDEHTHTDACRMTEEEAAQVNEIIARIDELPDLEEVYALLTAYNEAENREGYDADLTEIQKQVSEVYAIYAALTDTQQAQVTNIDKLLELVEGLGLNDAAETANEDTGIPEEVLAKLANELKIYPGKKTTDENDNEVWTAIDGSDEESANVKATVTLPSEITSGEGYYLYIRAVTKKDPYYPNGETIKEAVGDNGEYNENGIQCYAIHWIRIFQADEISEEPDTEAGKVIYTDNEGNKWVCEYNTDSVLGDNVYATIQIEYLDSSAYLAGDVNTRALQIFNSRTEDGKTLEEAATVTDIKVNGNYYTGFTFTTNRGGPYVFVSKVLTSGGYVSDISISSIIDGTAPFDNVDDTNSIVDGYDSSESNLIVRTFDTVQYGLSLSFKSLSDLSYTEATLHYEFAMDKSLTEATFDLEAMSWVKDSNSTYQIQYLDSEGNIILYLDSAGTLRKTADAVWADNGFYSGGTVTTINALATGSTENSGSNCYQYSDVVSQRIIGTYQLYNNGGTVIEGTTTLTAGIRVLNDINGDTIAPAFKVWLDGNERNYGFETSTDGSTSDTIKKEIDNTVTAAEIRISAGPLYNVEVKQNGYLAYKSWFDFSTGKEVTASSYTIGNNSISGTELYNLLEALGTLNENYGKSAPEEYTDDGNVCSAYLGSGLLLADYKAIFSNIRYGRMYGYGIGIQLANTDSSGDKGMKGLSLPYGDIALDLQFTTKATTEDISIDTSQYTSILWDYIENVNTSATNTIYTYEDGTKIQPVTPNTRYLGRWGRNLYWDSHSKTYYACEIVPWNYGGINQSKTQAYNGGNWKLSGDSTQTNALESSIYHFTISGYDFDLNDYTFPTCVSNGSATNSRYVNYEYTFSAGHAQILSVFPRTSSGTVNVKLTPTVGNLEITTVSGQNLSKESSSNQNNNLICYDYETNTAGTDNTLTTAVTVYSPGSATKRNSFIQRSGTGVGSNFLGVSGLGYWVRQYDSAAYVGDDIAIAGDSYISVSSDYHIRALNYLQLFDSYVLSIDEDLDGAQKDKITLLINAAVANTSSSIQNQCNVTFLYAADPDYPGGYNTNSDNKKSDGTITTASGMMNYMNTVREEDLVYYTSLDDLKAAGYTCIGVLAEVRNCDVKNGVIVAMRIPVIVNDAEGIVGTTIATVNTSRIWTTEGAMVDSGGNSISWTKGEWDSDTGKNVLEGYQSITGLDKNTAGDGTGNGFNLNNGNGSAGYVKVEYENGVKSGHTGGYVYGNSLLILGYKAGITIGVEQSTYNLTGGSVDINYTLSAIRTDIDRDITSSQTQTTSLNIDVDLTARHYGENSDYEDPNVNLINGTYMITVPQYETTTVNGKTVVKTDGSGNWIPDYKTDDDGNQIQQNITYTIGMTSGNAAEVTFIGSDGVQYTYSIYATPIDGRNVTFTLTDVPVGQTLPNITFSATLGSGLSNNDTITATASIGGSGDLREYSTVNGNQSDVTVSVYVLAATALTKSVDHTMVELDGTITYTVRYSNASERPIEKAYFYDLMPYNGDSRGSNYTDTVATDDTILAGINFESMVLGTNTPTNDFQADVTIYYSTEEESKLQPLLYGFNGTTDDEGADQEKVEEMLKENGIFEILGKMDKVENDDGTTTARYYRLAAQEKDFGTYENGEWVWKGSTDEEKAANEEAYHSFLASVNAIFVKVENMGSQRDIVMTLTMETNNSRAGDFYGNTAWSWVADTPDTDPLRSEIVQTVAVSRTISGKIWYDSNLDGVRDDDEALIEGITCTLFRLDESIGKYVPCTEDVTGATVSSYIYTGKDGTTQTIYSYGADSYMDENGKKVEIDTTNGTFKENYVGTVTTASDGSYHFSKLPAGKYVVAFSGPMLNKYTGATVYQVNKSNDSNTNDGVALGETNSDLDKQKVLFEGIDSSVYKYAIAYDLTETGGAVTAGNMPLHSLSDYKNNPGLLVDYQETIANQDLGLVIAGFELPKTGGTGTILFTIGGLLLMAGAVGCGYGLRRRRERRANG